MDAANAGLQSANVELASANTRVTRANTELESANVRERQRFDLAMEAIKLFHGEVSEDLLLKEKEFAGLRSRLLKGAAGFYGKLEHLMEGQPDPSSRCGAGAGLFRAGRPDQTDRHQRRGGGRPPQGPGRAPRIGGPTRRRSRVRRSTWSGACSTWPFRWRTAVTRPAADAS